MLRVIETIEESDIEQHNLISMIEMVIDCMSEEILKNEPSLATKENVLRYYIDLCK